MSSAPHFVNDGRERARAALEPVIRAQVAAEYVQRWRDASFFGRWRLRLEIEWEVNRRVDQRLERLAPRDALYWSASTIPIRCLDSAPAASPSNPT